MVTHQQRQAPVTLNRREILLVDNLLVGDLQSKDEERRAMQMLVGIVLSSLICIAATLLF